MKNEEIEIKEIRTPREISEIIFYKPCTNGKAEVSILEGEKLINNLLESQSKQIDKLKEENEFMKRDLLDARIEFNGTYELLSKRTEENQYLKEQIREAKEFYNMVCQSYKVVNDDRTQQQVNYSLSVKAKKLLKENQ